MWFKFHLFVKSTREELMTDEALLSKVNILSEMISASYLLRFGSLVLKPDFHLRFVQIELHCQLFPSGFRHIPENRRVVHCYLFIAKTWLHVPYLKLKIVQCICSPCSTCSTESRLSRQLGTWAGLQLWNCP